MNTSILLSVPLGAQIPEIINKFSPNENLLMCEIGSAAIQRIKTALLDKNTDEVTAEIRKEFAEKYKEDINKHTILSEYRIAEYEKEQKQLNETKLSTQAMLEDLRQTIVNEKQEYLIKFMNMEREWSLKLAEEMMKYRQLEENFENHLKIRGDEKCEVLREELRKLKQEYEKKEYEYSIQNKLEQTTRQQEKQYLENQLKTREDSLIKAHNEKCDVLKEELQKIKTAQIQNEYEKEKQTNEQLSKSIEVLNNQMIAMAKMNPKMKGDIGENALEELLITTFQLFDDFSLVNTSTHAHSGDFHLRFNGMTIMVDSKKYTNNVDSTSRNKLKADLKTNSHITKLAWLVSLESGTQKFNKAPFMFDVDDDNNNCICYINNLFLQLDPSEMLRTVWYASKVIYDSILNTDRTENGELNAFKKNEQRVKTHVTAMLKTSKMNFTLLNQLKENIEKGDKEIHDILINEVVDIQDVYKKKIMEWWEVNIVKREGKTIRSTPIYEKFCKDTETVNIRIDINTFKMILQKIVETENIKKFDGKNTQIQILNYTFV